MFSLFNDILVFLFFIYFHYIILNINIINIETEAILQDLEKESTFLNNQLNSTNENVLSQDCKEIVEEYDEEREKQWKIKHRENLKIHRQKECEESKSLIADDYIEKLDILQLQEEIEMLEKSDPDTENKLNLNNVKAKFSDLREKNKLNCVTDEDVMKRLNELELEEGIENKLEM